MAEVVKLVTKPEVRADGCIEVLENMLDMARKGEVTGVAIASVDRDGNTMSAFQGGENIAALIGSVERVKYRLLNYMAGE